MCDDSIDFDCDIKFDPDYVPIPSPPEEKQVKFRERRPFSILSGQKSVYKEAEYNPSISKRKTADESSRGGGTIFEEPFFVQISNKDDTGQQNLSAKCLTCKDKEVVIKGHKNVSSNFIKHLKRVHPEMYEIYENKKKTKVKRQSYSAPTSNLNDKIINFIADTMVPVSIVENPHFISLFEGLGADILDKRALSGRLNENFNTLMNNVKYFISQNRYFCVTADIWTCKGISFFGYTCHWISENFNRYSAALACKRFGGSLHINQLFDFINETNKNFGINQQNIVATVIGNGTNFVKSFKQNGILLLMEDMERSENIEGENFDGSELPDFVSFDEHINHAPVLPNYLQCASQTLTLIASTDFIDELKKNHSTYAKHLEIFFKCSKLWDKASRPISCEVITSTLGAPLSYPVVTRWTSIFDSVKQILHHRHKLSELCDKLMLSNFSLSELQYLEEYCVVMTPLAECLDFLQGEQATFYGYLIPSLATLKVKFDRIMSGGSLKYLNNELMAMSGHLLRRFNKFFALNEEAYDAVVASVTCPSIKFRWLNVISKTSNKTLEDLKNIVFEYANRISNVTQFNQQETEHIPFFDFGDEDIKSQPSGSQALNTTDWELMTYSSDADTNFEILKRYPTLMKLFLKYNSVVPSAASVERLFSFADIANAPNGNSHSLEKLVLLKANLKFK